MVELDADAARAAATAIAEVLDRALADPQARSVRLTRDEALLAHGLIEGLREQLDREAATDRA